MTQTPDPTLPSPTRSNTSRRFARPRLLLAWLIILCSMFLFWQHQNIWALILIMIHGFVRPETQQERSAAFRRPEEWIPLTLFAVAILSMMLLPSDHPLHSFDSWWALTLITSFLLWRLCLDIRLYRTLPPFRANSIPRKP